MSGAFYLYPKWVDAISLYLLRYNNGYIVAMKFRIRIIYTLILLLAMSIVGCREEQGFSTDTSHRLAFSSDTVRFDTLFTSVSSSTYSFLIYNRNKADLRIASVHLSGGEQSPYRVNLDGLSGASFSDVAIRGGDSLYVFVEVTVDPRGQDAPFEVCDSIVFALESGVIQRVQLRAYGQDATVLRGVSIDSDTRFTAQRPYLIYDSLRVEEGSTLYLDAGVRLYFRDKVEMQVYGRVEAVGTADSAVVFRGARTDHMFSYLPYDRLSAQWGGITLHETSHDNLFVYCDIHGGTYGLRAKAYDMSRSKLVMQNSQIHNVDEDALQLTLCAGSFANSLFTNAGGHCVNLLGGSLSFVHCTMANFFPWKSERGVAVNISNYDEESQTIYPLLGVDFINSIITGGKDDELMGTVLEKTDSADYSEYARYRFTHSLVNSKGEAREPDTLHFAHIVWEHKDSTTYGRTNFRTIDHDEFIYDFHLDSLSIARGIASPAYVEMLPYDKDDLPRIGFEAIDAGCYQYHQPE
jgi:hypothetical protein